MNISWLVNQNICTEQSEGRSMFGYLKKEYPSIRMDIMDGEKLNGNRIPRPSIRLQFDKIFRWTDYRNYLNYLWIKKHRVDILHIYHSYLFRKILNMLDIKNRPKIVITLHGSDSYIRPWINNDWNEFYAIHSKNIEAFITFSQNQKEYLNRWGLPLDKIHVVPPGSPFQKAIPIKRKLNNSIKLISAFRLSWHKNLLGHLNFIKELKNHFDEVQYHVFGGGYEEEIAQFYYLADKLQITDIVKYKGNIENDLLLNKMQEYDFLLHLSISESIATSIVEAQSRGLIPIVSNVGGLGEVVKHMETGFIREFDNFEGFFNDINYLRFDSNRYATMSENCIKNFTKYYTTEIVSNKMLDIYKYIMSL